MKKFLLVFCFIFLVKISFAADWSPVGAKWTWGLIQECCGPPPRPDYPFYWNCVKDTIIQNRYCTIVELGGHHYAQEPQWQYRYIYNSNNDTITRFIDNKFLPVYDFTKHTGDTSYIVTDSGNYSCDTFLFVIDSVKPLLQNNNLNVQYGKLITNINCSRSNQVVDYLTIIEKVGLSHLYTKNYYFVFDVSHGYIRCYEDISFNLHLSSISCDSIIDMVKEKYNTNLPIKIYPNPTSEKISVEFSENEKFQAVKIFLMDLQGRIIKSVENNLQINVSDCSNGLYYLKIIAEDEFVTKSIIIQH